MRNLFLVTVLFIIMQTIAPWADLRWTEGWARTNDATLRNAVNSPEQCWSQSKTYLANSAQAPSAGSEPTPANPPRSAKLKIRIAGAQISVSQNVKANQATISRAIDFALAEKADILLTPEGSLSGYTNDFDPVAVTQALNALTEKARKAGLAKARRSI